MRTIITLAIATSASLSTAVAQTSNALDFDGINDQVASPFSTFDLYSDISLTCWLKPLNASPVYPDYDGIWGLSYNPHYQFYLIQKDQANHVEGHFRSLIDTADHVVQFDGLQVGVWQHLALVAGGLGTMTMYYNGDSVASTSSSWFFNTGELAVAFLGSTIVNGTSQYLHGQLDEATIWVKRLSSSEVNCIYHEGVVPTTIGLRGYFRMDEGVAGGNNTSISVLSNSAGGLGGNFSGFALNGPTSNFVAGVPVGNQATASICVGGSYDFNGQLLTAPGTYTTGFNVGGSCDSIVTLTLTQYTQVANLATDSICIGGSYDFNGQVLTTPGTYTTGFNIGGPCDSIVTLTLTQYTQPATLVSDTICQGETVAFNGWSLGSSGTYTGYFDVGGACDSIVTLALVAKTVNTAIAQVGPVLTCVNAGAQYQWVNCDNNYAQIPGATAQSFTATANGRYAAVVAQNGCIDTSGCYHVTTVGIEEPLGPITAVSPTFTSDQLRIDLAKTANAVEVTVLDIGGREVMRAEMGGTRLILLDASMLRSGAYILQVRTSEERGLARFVKE